MQLGQVALPLLGWWKQLLETWCPCGWGHAPESRATPGPPQKDPGTPGMWVGLGRVRSSALGKDFVLGGVFMEEFLLAAAVIGYFEF